MYHLPIFTWLKYVLLDQSSSATTGRMFSNCKTHLPISSIHLWKITFFYLLCCNNNQHQELFNVLAYIIKFGITMYCSHVLGYGPRNASFSTMRKHSITQKGVDVWA